MRLHHLILLSVAVISTACLAQISGRSDLVFFSRGDSGAMSPPAAVPSTKRPEYSLVRVQTYVQTLANGTQVRTRIETRIAQDANGRTRMEMLREKDGVMQSEGININDPSKRETIVLHPRSRVAEVRRSPEPPAWNGPRQVDREYGEAMKAEYQSQPKNHIHSDTENLEPKTMFGERAQGTKTTTVIPVGEVGNEVELRSVSEQWFAPRLQLSLLNIYDDPRSGRNTDEVTALHAGPPDASLFEVPSGYRVFDLSPDSDTAKARAASLQ